MRSLLVILLALSSSAHASLAFTQNDAEMDVMVQIGKGLERFQVDTGAVTSMILGAGDHMNFPVVGGSTTEGLAGQSSHCDNVKIPKIGFDTLDVNLKTMLRCAAGSNLIGLDILKGRLFKFNFSESKIEFADRAPTPTQVDEQNALYWSRGGHIQIPAHLLDSTADGVSIRAIFDTGAAQTTVDLTYAKQHPDIFEDTGRTVEVPDVVGVKQTQAIYHTKEIKIGGIRFTNVFVFVTDMRAFMTLDGDSADNVPMIVGWNIIKGGDWIFDLRNPQGGSFSVKPRTH